MTGAVEDLQSRIDFLERENAWLRHQNKRLEERLRERLAREEWRRQLAQQPTKRLNPAEKDVAEDLYAVFRGRARYAKAPDRPIYIEGRAKGLGLSAGTYGTALKTLEENNVIIRTECRDPKTGHKRVVVMPTEKFWNAATICREQERNYDYRARRCPDHPDAGVTEIRETRRVQITRETISRTFVCDDCGSIVDREDECKEVDAQTLEYKTDRLISQQATKPQVVACPPNGISTTETQPANTGIKEEYTEGEALTPVVSPGDPNADPEPAWLVLQPSHVPQFLLDQSWMIARPEPRAGGGWGKPPRSPHTGERASKTDPSASGTFAEAWDAMKRYNLPLAGIVLGGEERIVAIDVDKCRDPDTGELTRAARQIVSTLPTYWEISPSGTGIRGFMRGTKPEGSGCRWRIAACEIEVYHAKAFVTVTGHRLPGASVQLAECSAELAQLHDVCDGPPVALAALTPAPSPVRDEEVLARAFSAKNGQKVHNLHDGFWQQYSYPSQSEADIALMGYYLHFGASPDQAERLFSQSALHNREKVTARPDYVRRTLQSALRGCSPRVSDRVEER